MTTIITKCTISDLPELQKISGETFADTFGPFNSPENVKKYIQKSYSEEQLINELTDPQSQFFFIKVNNRSAGYLKVNVGDVQTENMGSDGLEIQRIYIRSQYKHQGLGSQLLRKGIGIARELHKSFVWLGVWENNHDALKFYQKFGFNQYSDHIFTLGGSEQRDLIMKKMIN
ncbi:GNAT family N-acetyltransferase [Lentilactobacillus kefiri]|uniref:N-acetyltransferase GCN5 n=2 Tax=Lentilactobacillus kefiri TaxID=33962 RepID=A0A8E1RJ83_LENKE|nr:GNAT family N-acetyltransferase [Lentilactobacillus kefiri]KRL56278.1 N-acetyltransferase GCN5 [Lentilactobacillus parakefiri DSM 10551]KRM51658.1 N-acetyltransferase GCN5 [Lentilactobacillus kefiri DSM 20587 = JCM 5818]GEL28474.1 spermidine/spermine N(1)-acetyltransferase [Lentilactobacillus kefiri]